MANRSMYRKTHPTGFQLRNTAYHVAIQCPISGTIQVDRSIKVLSICIYTKATKEYKIQDFTQKVSVTKYMFILQQSNDDYSGEITLIKSALRASVLLSYCKYFSSRYGCGADRRSGKA